MAFEIIKLTYLLTYLLNTFRTAYCQFSWVELRGGHANARCEFVAYDNLYSPEW